MDLKKLLAGVAVASVLTAGAAHADINFSDNFDGESAPGVSILNHNAFANWDVVGQVDLVSTPNPYGLTGSGAYVDLDGTAGPGAIISKQTFAIKAGDFVTWSFDLSGNQRDENNDTFVFGLDFDGPGLAHNLSLNGGPGGDYGYGAFSHTVNTIVIGPHVGWTSSVYTFTAMNDVNAKIYFGSTSSDNIGTLVDNVGLTTKGAVPEPASWALMIGGFGLAGAALRRRRAVVAA